MTHSVIVAAKRTPIGSFQGAFANTPAPQLGAVAIKAVVKVAGIDPNEIQEVIMGNVLTAGIGQAPARQASIYAGLPDAVAALTIGKVCGSGLKAIMLADQAIRAGDTDVVIAGGMENMSLAPYALEKARSGYRMGNGEIVDLMVKDGLFDPYSKQHMGVIGEKCASECKISRADQDKFAAESYTRALAAISSGRFSDEIAPVEIAGKKGVTLVASDEEPAKGDVAKLSELRTAFDKNGTITAGNASSINDGAAAVLVLSEEKAKKLNLKPLVRIVAQAQSSQSPDWFTTAPAVAMEKALRKAGLKASDIDLWEVNEAFAVVALANNQLLGLSTDNVNPFGGAIALGHPIGASGCRLLVTLLHSLSREGKHRGVVSLCIGGGEGIALTVER